METKFTKGQWVIDSDFITVEVDGIDEVICDFHPEGVWPTVYQRSEEEKDANAKLIAAAPELLEALTDLVTASDLSSNSPVVGNWNELINNAKKAIKKATE